MLARSPAGSDLAAGSGPSGGNIQRDKTADVFTAQEQTKYRAQITAGRTATKDISTKFSAVMDTGAKFISAFREKSSWVNGAYSLGYGHHATLVKTIGADDATRQVIANLVVALGLNLATEGMADVLEGAKLISQAVGFWGDQLGNTVAGAVLAPDVPIAKVDPGADPAFKELMGLRRLDELNAVFLPLATNGGRNLLAVMAEAGDLSDALSATEADPKKIAKDDFLRRLTALQKLFDLVPQSVPAIDKQAASYATLWATFYASPWPDDRRSEQDIWITWLSTQVTSTESWSASAFGSSVENYKLTDHLADIGVSGAQQAGGRLGVAAKPDWKLKQAAAAQTADIAKYWAKVFLQ